MYVAYFLLYKRPYCVLQPEYTLYSMQHCIVNIAHKKLTGDLIGNAAYFSCGL